MSPDPFNPLVYWPHVVFGIASVALAVTAIATRKGSRVHRLSGMWFSIAMGIAAVTAIAFSFVRFAPPAIFSALSVLYCVVSGILTLRPRRGPWRVLQATILILPAMLMALGFSAVVALFGPEPRPPWVELVGFGAAAGFFAVLAWGDVRAIRNPDVPKTLRFRRHALRMAVAAAETVRAPLISFGPSLGEDGSLTFPVYFFGPFALAAIVYYAAMPSWVRRPSESPGLTPG